MPTGTAEEFAVLSAIARLATYMGTVLSVPVLRRKMAQTPRTIRLPGGDTILELRRWSSRGDPIAANIGTAPAGCSFPPPTAIFMSHGRL
jgi:hypothetical protein